MSFASACTECHFFQNQTCILHHSGSTRFLSRVCCPHSIPTIAGITENKDYYNLVTGRIAGWRATLIAVVSLLISLVALLVKLDEIEELGRVKKGQQSGGYSPSAAQASKPTP